MRGAGPTVLVLHGNGEDADDLGPVIDDLARDFRVVAPDSRAHGRSPRGSGPLTIARMADDTAAVLREIGTGPVHVVGFSDGGNIGLMLALLHPDLVRSLIVYGANVDPAGMTAGCRAEVTAAGYGLRVAARVFPGLRVRAEVVDLMVRQPRIPLRALERIEVPVLVAAGERDIIRPEHTAAMVAHLPHGREHIEPGVGHGWPLTSPVEFARLVREQLARV